MFLPWFWLDHLLICFKGCCDLGISLLPAAWCISHKGPVFAAMFSPLQVITVAMFWAITVAERLHFGSLIGALLIIVGLYCVLWGKEEKRSCC
ncbi:hypothetical protein C1H46_027584 [Malus baccata]|uniref:WAT1-related protein n=1 Tax=Malus baccata TaxID=106549 RepID=A0A540LK17_MALBA|nr:hypothetical protein C1H46_027584 [Malus baccata]